MKALLWTLVVLAVLAIGVDRGGALVAENITASRLQDDQGLPRKPDVSIGGFPFLTQFAKGRYEHVTARAASVPVEKTDLTLASLSLDFRDVTSNRDFTRFTADRARATAVIGYGELGKAYDLDASYAGNGRVNVVKSFDVLGQTIRPKATVGATYSRGSLRLDDLRLGGIDLPDVVRDQVSDLVESAIDDKLQLDDLPFDVTVRSVSATPAGIRLQLRGTDLSYSG